MVVHDDIYFFKKGFLVLPLRMFSMKQYPVATVILSQHELTLPQPLFFSPVSSLWSSLPCICISVA